MSTAPTGYIGPKTNWAAGDKPVASDFNRIEGNTVAVETGERTIDPVQAPSGNVGSLRQLLNWLPNRLKAITGAANWWDAPAITLAGVVAKLHETAGHKHTGTEGDGPKICLSGVDSTAITSAGGIEAGRLAVTDANGRVGAADTLDGKHAIDLDAFEHVRWDDLSTPTSRISFEAAEATSNNTETGDITVPTQDTFEDTGKNILWNCANGAVIKIDAEVTCLDLDSAQVKFKLIDDVSGLGSLASSIVKITTKGTYYWGTTYMDLGTLTGVRTLSLWVTINTYGKKAKNRGLDLHKPQVRRVARA